MNHLLVMSPLTAVFLFAAQFTADTSKPNVGAKYTFGICHRKIDPKKLKGDEYAEAWNACRADPEAYE